MTFTFRQRLEYITSSHSEIVLGYCISFLSQFIVPTYHSNTRRHNRQGKDPNLYPSPSHFTL